MGLAQERERAEMLKNFGVNAELEKQLKERQANEIIALIDAQDKAFEESEKVRTDKEKAKAKEAQDLIIRDKKAQLEAKLLNIRDDFQAEQDVKAELALFEMETLLANDLLTTNERLKIEAEYQLKIQELTKQTAEHDKKLKQDSINAGIEWAEKGLNALGDLTSAYFDTKLSKVEKGSKAEEVLARKQFKINKAMQLGGAIIDGTKAVMSSLAMSPVAIGPVPNPAGIASLAFVAASGIASIAKIAATKFEGGGGGGNLGVDPPSITAPSTSGGDGGSSTLTQGLQGGQPTPPQVVLVVDSVTKAINTSTQVAVVSTIG